MAIADTIEKNETVTKVAVKPPSKFNVVLFNDNTTSFEFVMQVLEVIFHKSPEDASEITRHIHNHGRGIAGTYSHEVATQKREETLMAAKANGFPLRCEIEES